MPPALLPAPARPSIPMPHAASPMVAAPEDPKCWVLLTLRMRLRLGAGEPWQPGKDGGFHGDRRRSIRSWLWARDAPGGVGGRTKVPPRLRNVKASARGPGKPPLLQGLPLACSAWKGWAAGGWQGPGSTLGPAAAPLCPLPPSTPAAPRQPRRDVVPVPACSVQGSNRLCRSCSVKRGLLAFCSQEGLLSISACFRYKHEPQISCQPAWGPPPPTW